MRLRITFAKTDAMRFTGHLDLHKTWERTMRRAGLPLAYSQGFNPHPHINLASALPLGFTGDREVIDIWLEHDLPLEEILTALQKVVPPGISIQVVEEIDPHQPTLQVELEASEFVITFLDTVADLAARLGELQSSPSLERQWRGKNYDLKPLIVDLQPLPDDDHGRQRLQARMIAKDSATGRPEEIISALGIAPERTRVHRTQLIFREQGMKNSPVKDSLSG